MLINGYGKDGNLLTEKRSKKAEKERGRGEVP
jgi:hypothetical protein